MSPSVSLALLLIFTPGYIQKLNNHTQHSIIMRFRVFSIAVISVSFALMVTSISEKARRVLDMNERHALKRCDLGEIHGSPPVDGLNEMPLSRLRDNGSGGLVCEQNVHTHAPISQQINRRQQIQTLSNNIIHSSSAALSKVLRGRRRCGPRTRRSIRPFL